MQERKACTTASLELGQFLSYVTNEVDCSSLDGLMAASESLVALSNNKMLLADVFNREFQATFDATRVRRLSRIIVLAQADGFHVRAVIWTPVPKSVDGLQFFYGIAHDHDFDFITTSFFGSGYNTDVYRLISSPEKLSAGDAVTLRCEGSARLREGYVLGMQAGVDVHVQHPPSEVSVSLNLVSDHMLKRSPLWYDVEAQKVIGEVDHTRSIRELIVDAAAALSAIK